MKVRQAMHQGVQWVSPETTLVELARLLREHDIGAIPIGENDRLIGIVTDRDITCRAVAEGLDPRTTKALQIMTKGIVFCRTEEELDDAARLMEDKQIRRLPVIDGRKRMVGMLSMADVSHSGSRGMGGELLHAVAVPHKH